ncbi:MAG: hypothetical protein AAFO06_16300 [Cyanobacteria bacterium J06597_16]
MKPFTMLKHAVLALGLWSTVFPAQLLAQPTASPSRQTEPAPVDTVQTPVQANFSLGVIRSQLSDLDRFPLFLPEERGQLIGSSEQLSPTQSTRPSLFWISDQVGNRLESDRLIDQWHAYTIRTSADAGSPDNGSSDNGELSYVDVVVNEKSWNLLNYFDRYAFILQFGIAAQSYGYNLRVFNDRDALNALDDDTPESSRSGTRLVRLRGAYFCSFQGQSWPLTPEIAAQIPCTIELDEASRRPPVTINQPTPTL